MSEYSTDTVQKQGSHGLLRTKYAPSNPFWEVLRNLTSKAKSSVGIQPKLSKLDQLRERYAMVYSAGKMLMWFRADDEFHRPMWLPLSSKADFLRHAGQSDEASNYFDRTPEDRKFDYGFGFFPGKVVTPGWLNIWRGWGVKPKPGNWDLIKRHVLEVLANGDLDHADYILKWLAWAVQNPNSPPETALVFRGKKGSGKGTLGRVLERIFGSHVMSVNKPDQFTGRFNGHLRNTVSLFVDEGFWAGDKKGEGTLKAMVTEPTLTLEAKYKDITTVRNCLHIVMASNEEWVVPATKDERRFAVFDVNDKYAPAICGEAQSKAYFEPLHAQIGGDGCAAMLWDLSEVQLGGWHPRSDYPKTAALQEQSEFSDERTCCINSGSLGVWSAPVINMARPARRCGG